MKNFAHVNARSLDEAVSALRRYGKRAAVIAGGTDLLGKMKDEILPVYPEALVNIKTIPGLDSIAYKDGALAVGALARLEDIATDEVVRKDFHALAEAARRAASTHLREMGTLGATSVRTSAAGTTATPITASRASGREGGRCYAIDGDNRYHSIFGGSVEKGCYAVHPSDIAPALIALDASIKTTRRTIKAEDFFQVSVTKTTVLDDDEIATLIEISPRPAKARLSSSPSGRPSTSRSSTAPL